MNDLIPYLDLPGEGPLLLFAHANAYPPGSYRQFLTPVRAHYHVWAMAQRPLWRGHAPEEMEDWHLFADDLVRFLAQHGVDGDDGGIVGVGHSLGAVITMAAAVKHPGLFRALVLIEPVFLLPPLLEAAAAFPEAADELPLVQIARERKYRWPSRDEAFAHFRERSVFSRLPDSALWDYVNFGLRETGDGAVELAFSREWEARIYSRPPLDVWELLPQVTQPTLALRGATSTTLVPEAWSLWQTAQPAAEFVEIPEAGHLVTMERPLATISPVLRFLGRLEAAKPQS